MDIKKKALTAYSGTMETMYARDANSNIKVWQIGILNNRLAVYYGRLNGKLSRTSLNDNCTSSNPIVNSKILTLIERKIKDKRKEGYVFLEEIEGRTLNNLSMTNTDGSGRSLVMRAAKLKLEQIPKLEKFEWLLQPKYDGVRCTAEFSNESDIQVELFEEVSEYTLLSREGSEYSAPIIEKELGIALNFLHHSLGLKDFKLDGELYIHGKPLDYIRTCIPIKKEADIRFSIPSGNPNEITYIVYDIMIANVSQLHRHNMLAQLNEYMIEESCTIVQIDDGEIMSISDAITSASFFRNTGYEGGIIRRLDSDYKFGSRTSMVRKIKFSNDGEFEILEILDEGVVNIAGKDRVQVKVRLRNDKTNDTFLSIPGNPKEPWTNDRKAKLIEDRDSLIGKMATIKYMERSSNQLPIQSNLITIRDYE